MKTYTRILTRTTALIPATLLATVVSHANPLDGQVVAGSATITTLAPATEVITQQTNSAIINWKAFDIGVGETTQFVLPDSTGVTLNRVVSSQDPSKILGTLSSNGTVMVVNPDGILFGPHAVVNVGGLLATTSDISDQDFMARNYQFVKPGKSTASIVNQGKITVKDEGIAALVAPGVRNEGVISAKLGKVTLSAANKFTLDFYGDDLIKLMLDDTLEGEVISTATGKPLADKVANAGTISANGGTVVLKAATARQVVNSVINNTGVIEANSVGLKEGKIVLSAATADTKVASTTTIPTPKQVVKVSGTLSASGKMPKQHGGMIAITGEELQLISANLIASGDTGGGTILVGGDYLGGKASDQQMASYGISREATSVPTATNVFVDPNSTINADATGIGKGGKVVVWAADHTNFAGSISSQGGLGGGNGGFAEVSGHNSLAFDGSVNLGASSGANGTLLLDPLNVVIGGTGASGLAVSKLQDTLKTSNVIVSTGSTGSTGTEAGDITVAANVLWSSNNSLTLEAYRNVVGNAGVSIKNTGAGNLRIRADSGGTGFGTAIPNGSAFVDYSQSTGKVELFYNPTGPNKYQHPTNFTTHFLANSAVTNQAIVYMLVNNVNDLQAINTNLNGYYAMGRDIDASSSNTWNAGSGFIPLGDSAPGFIGNFNGDGHTISNLVEVPGHGTTGANIMGLFGYVGAGATVQNVHLINEEILDGVGGLVAGGVAGTNYGNIINVTNSGGIIGGWNNVAGGLVGINWGLISKSSESMNVVTNGVTTGPGGIVGGLTAINYGTIDQSFSDGWATISYNLGGTVGGLVGVNRAGGVITNSYSHSVVRSMKTAITGNYNRAGGLVGLDLGSISNSYATGTFEVSGELTQAGGLSAFHGISSSENNSYWDMTSSGQLSSAGGTGRTTSQLKSGLPAGFSSIFWAIDPAVNGGYPYLKWQVSVPVVTSTLGPTSFVGPTLQSVSNPAPIDQSTAQIGTGGPSQGNYVSPIAIKIIVTQGVGVPWSNNSSKIHTGTDIAAPAGTPVNAVSAGTVVKVGWLGKDPVTGLDWGYYVIIQRPDGTASGYLHLAKTTFSVGDPIVIGQQIGTVLRDHLHYNECLTATDCQRGAVTPSQFSQGNFLQPKFTI